MYNFCTGLKCVKTYTHTKSKHLTRRTGGHKKKHNARTRPTNEGESNRTVPRTPPAPPKRGGGDTAARFSRGPPRGMQGKPLHRHTRCKMRAVCETGTRNNTGIHSIGTCLYGMGKMAVNPWGFLLHTPSG